MVPQKRDCTRELTYPVALGWRGAPLLSMTATGQLSGGSTAATATVVG